MSTEDLTSVKMGTEDHTSLKMTNTLVRDGVESIMNPFDENALEMALHI